VAVVATAVAVAGPVLLLGDSPAVPEAKSVRMASSKMRMADPPPLRLISHPRTPTERGWHHSGSSSTQEWKRRELRRAAEKEARRLERQRIRSQPTVFNVASFNVLGASHTSGRTANKRGYSTGYARMGVAADLINARGIDVVGFQEFEDPQLTSFLGNTGGAFGVYPGRALGPKSIRFSIAWRLSEWTLVSANSVPVPYAGGGRILMPYILLRNNATQREVYFANFHNPADTSRLGRHNGRWRAIATGIEVALANRLVATGHPLVITGDMNDRAGYFCRMTTGAPMHAAIGGSVGAPCAPPRAMQVDWIFGSTEIQFSGYVTDRRPPIPRVSDHAMVYAQATVAPPGQ
jgi:hypothetical protein